jgi:hypothetical protein
MTKQKPKRLPIPAGLYGVFKAIEEAERRKAELAHQQQQQR